MTSDEQLILLKLRHSDINVYYYHEHSYYYDNFILKATPLVAGMKGFELWMNEVNDSLLNIVVYPKHQMLIIQPGNFAMINIPDYVLNTVLSKFDVSEKIDL